MADPLLDRLLARHTQRQPSTGKLQGLTILSMGLGRDSMTIAALAADGKLELDGERLGLEDLDAIVFSDTGNEWPFTYAVIPELEKLLAGSGTPFFILRKPPERLERPWREKRQALFRKAWRALPGGMKRAYDHKLAKLFAPELLLERSRATRSRPWHREKWPSIKAKAAGGGYHDHGELMAEMSAYSRIATRSSPECTIRHKIDPINRFIADLTAELRSVHDAPGKRPNSAWELEVLSGRATPHRIMIGYAADPNERKRAARAAKTVATMPWKRELYPLIDMDIDKHGEGRILARHDLDWIRKSGCYMCAEQSPAWFAALSVLHPAIYRRVVKHEVDALKRNPTFSLIQAGKGHAGTPVTVHVLEWLEENPRADLQRELDKGYERKRAF